MRTGFEKPLVIASHFGFVPIDSPKITDADLKMVEDCALLHHFDPAEKTAFIRYYLEKNLSAEQHPLAFAYKKSANKKRPAGYTLHFVGAPGGVGEALLIRTALSILGEEGYKHVRLDLNSIGDKESQNIYERELSNAIRKLGTTLNPDVRDTIKKDIFDLFRREEPEIATLRESLPPSISFLTPPSRNYFKEVLEYIEVLDVEFKLDPTLVGDRSYCSHTIFAVRENEENKNSTLAVGYSYSRLGKKLGLKKEIPMTAVTVFIEPRPSMKVYKELPRPKFYLIQLGREAKMLSLSVLEHLRANRIPVGHLVGKDKITAQLMGAEQSRATHLIILGQKEALDGTATIRNVTTRAQDTIPLELLPNFLKNLPL